MSTGDGFAVGTKPGYGAWSAGPLVTVAYDAGLSLTASIGQRTEGYRFDLVDGVSDDRLGTLEPYIAPASIGFDTSRVVKRDLRLTLAQSDIDAINPLTDRVLAYMLIAGQEWPLGRFMFAAGTYLRRSREGEDASSLSDEMLLVDQEIPVGFAARGACDRAMLDVTDGLLLPRGRAFAASPYAAVGGWRIGSGRGGILDTLAQLGDLETPWMDNTGVMRTVRTVDPATADPDLSFDDGYPVISDSIGETTEVLEAPNRFVVVGNGAQANEAEIVGRYDIPASAPHSIYNRGIVIQRTLDMPVASVIQAQALARSIGTSYAPAEQTEVTTPADPRHDGYQVIRWRGIHWLETAWSLSCVAGGDMTHTLRRWYV